MSVLDRLRAWWRGLVGGERVEAEVDDTGVSAYECAVCGTSVDDPEGPCPLCNGTDVVAVAERPSTTSDPVEPAETRRPDDASASADRLRSLREVGDVLERHQDRWKPVDEGILVETDDGDRIVETREEAAELLRD